MASIIEKGSERHKQHLALLEKKPETKSQVVEDKSQTQTSTPPQRKPATENKTETQQS